MNSILCLLILAAYSCLLEVNCRSVQMDRDVHTTFEFQENKDLHHGTENGGKFSWKRLKPMLKRELQRIRNVKGETSKLNLESVESTSSIPSKEKENLFNANVEKSVDIALKAESPVLNFSSIKLEVAKNSQNEDPNSELNVPEELTSNMTHVDMSQLDHPLIASELPDNVFSNILNQSGDSLLFQALNDNSSKIDSFEIDETTLLSEGGHIATLQEVSTIGFELLIDSETKKNLILMELLSSQSNLIGNDDFPDKDDISFVTVQFSPGNESDALETTTNEDIVGITFTTDFGSDEDKTDSAEFDTDEGEIVNVKNGTDIEDEIENSEIGTDEDETESAEFGTDEGEIEIIKNGTDAKHKIENTEIGRDEDETESAEFGTNKGEIENIKNGTDAKHKTENTDENETENAKFGTDEDEIESTEFDIDENEIENPESGIDENEMDNIELNTNEDRIEDTEFDTDEDKIENIEFGTDEIETENEDISTDQIKNASKEFDFSDSLKDANVTEITDAHPKCPDPGWCVFWFLALDTCAKDSHCHGSLICCMIGCSKTCIDPDDEHF